MFTNCSGWSISSLGITNYGANYAITVTNYGDSALNSITVTVHSIDSPHPFRHTGA
ncbi:hypothetical protein MTBUT4_190046 [Magnetospirillum sp. UT-4]|nr:hypothetical protein MTBUT4_190046 [Magnetospirillum sp. UT-4]